MKTKIIITVVVTVISSVGYAQDIDGRTVIRKNRKGITESVEYSSANRSVNTPVSSETFFKDVLKTQKADIFKRMHHKSKKKDFTHEHYDQYYDGIVVDGGGYNFHYKNGKMFFAHGNYISINNLDVNPAVSAEKAKNVFAVYKNIPNRLITDYNSELIIKEIPLNADTVPILSYKIILTADHPDNNEIGFVDAKTGKIVMTEPVFIDFAATGTLTTRYSGTQTAVTHYYNGAYHLVDSTTGRAVIHTWDKNGNTSLGTIGMELSDNDNNWTQSEHLSGNKNMALDVHWVLQQIRNRLFVTHGINSMVVL